MTVYGRQQIECSKRNPGDLWIVLVDRRLPWRYVIIMMPVYPGRTIKLKVSFSEIGIEAVEMPPISNSSPRQRSMGAAHSLTCLARMRPWP